MTTETTADAAYTYVFTLPGVGSYAGSGPLVICNNAPLLQHTGETNFVTSGVYPLVGPVSSSFQLRCKYTDQNGDAVASGYPKVRILLDGTEVSGSPFEMSYVSGNALAGAIYTYSFVSSLSSGTYNYSFIAQDRNGGSATTAEESFVSVNNPSVIEPLLPKASPCNAPEWFIVTHSSQPAFSIRWQDQYNLLPANSYPKLYLSHNGAESSYLMHHAGSNVYSVDVPEVLDAGIWNYWYVHRNIYNDRDYSTAVGSFTVTYVPFGFVNTSANAANGARDNVHVVANDVVLSWTGAEIDSTYAYKLYFGTDSHNLQQVYAGNAGTYMLNNLSPDTCYYWSVLMTNQYGISAMGPLQSFTTLAADKKVFVVPNPFRAGRAKTDIVFNMPDDGYVTITIFDEMGVELFQDHIAASAGTNTYKYNGRADNGKTLFNGSYICQIRKHYDNKDKEERCRLFVVK
jgi:hypothetical protein